MWIALTAEYLIGLASRGILLPNLLVKSNCSSLSKCIVPINTQTRACTHTHTHTHTKANTYTHY